MAAPLPAAQARPGGPTGLGSGTHSPCSDAARRPAPEKGQPRLREQWRGRSVCALGVPQERRLPNPLGLTDLQEPVPAPHHRKGLTRAPCSYADTRTHIHAHGHTHAQTLKAQTSKAAQHEGFPERPGFMPGVGRNSKSRDGLTDSAALAGSLGAQQTRTGDVLQQMLLHFIKRLFFFL